MTANSFQDTRTNVQKAMSFERNGGSRGVATLNAPAPQEHPENPFWYLHLTDATFCRLLEQSANLAATDYEGAIRNRLSRFAPWLVEHVAGITETPLQGVWCVTFEGGVSQTALRSIDTSGLLKTVGCYQTGQGSWAIAVRLVCHD